MTPAGRRRAAGLLARRQTRFVQLLGLDRREAATRIARDAHVRSDESDLLEHATLFTPTTGVVSWSSFLPTNDAVIFEDELVSGNGQFGYTWRTGHRCLGRSRDADGAHARRAERCRSNGTPYLPTYGANHTGTPTPAQLRADRQPGGLRRLCVGRVHQPAPLRQRRHDARLRLRSAQLRLDRNIITPKKLWVAAIDLNAPPGTDPSHPAFYLPAQELYAGNSRGDWTVDPCEADGDVVKPATSVAAAIAAKAAGAAGSFAPASSRHARWSSRRVRRRRIAAVAPLGHLLHRRLLCGKRDPVVVPDSCDAQVGRRAGFSSLVPRKLSSGIPDSNWRPSAWEADTLPLS